MGTFIYLGIGFMAGCVFAVVVDFIDFYIHERRK